MQENHGLKLQVWVYTPTYKILSKPQTRLIHGEHVLKLQKQTVQVLKTQFKFVSFK